MQSIGKSCTSTYILREFYVCKPSIVLHLVLQSVYVLCRGLIQVDCLINILKCFILIYG